jgi:hypothetical protein
VDRLAKPRKAMDRVLFGHCHLIPFSDCAVSRC